MPHRTIALALAAALLVSCAGQGDDEMAAAADTAPSVSPDEQALEDLRAYWETHYNMHHADMVASTYADSAWTLPADGGWIQGRAAIEADLAQGMAASPTATIGAGDIIVVGDRAVTMGSYEVAVDTAAGNTRWSGSYLNILTKASGEWKILGSITNYNGAIPENVTWSYLDSQPDDEGTMAELTDYYSTHWNMGHPSMVADAYTDDARVSFSDRPTVQGRAAIEALLTESIASGAQLVIHDVSTLDLGGGWAVDGGWYRLDGPDGGDLLQTGAYLNLLRQQADGSWKIHRFLSNAQPAR